MPATLRCSLVLSALAVLTGCGRAPDAPKMVHVVPGLSADAVTGATPAAAPVALAGDEGFVDLTVGDHAVAARIFRLRIRPTGGPIPGDWLTIHDRWDRTVTGMESVGEQAY